MRMLKLKLALFSIAAGVTVLGLGACIGDLVADAITLRGID